MGIFPLLIEPVVKYFFYFKIKAKSRKKKGQTKNTKEQLQLLYKDIKSNSFLNYFDHERLHQKKKYYFAGKHTRKSSRRRRGRNIN